jgi:PAS domain S-box-containing protein
MASRDFAFGAPTLHDLTVALAGAGSIDDVANEILERGADVVGATSAHLSVVIRPGWRRDFVGGVLRDRGGSGRGVDRPIALDTPLSRAMVTRQEQVFESREQYRATFPHLSRDLERVSTRTAVTVPLRRADGDVIGALTYGFDEPAPVPVARRGTAAQVADIGALALDRAVLLHREREAARRALRLHAAATELAGVVSTDDLASVLRRACTDALSASHCVTYALEVDGSLRLVSTDETNAYPSHLPLGAPNPVRDAIALSGTVVVESPEQFSSRYGSTRWPADAALLALPMNVGARSVGVLHIVFDAARRFSPEDRSLATGLAEQAAMALDRALLHERAEVQSTLVARERDRLMAITSSIQDGLFTSTSDGLIIEANDRFCEITGYSRDVVVGARPPYPWWPNAGADAVMRFVDQLREHARPDRGPHEIHLTFQHPDGRRIMGLITAAVLRNPRGEAIGAVATVKDVTASVQAERRLRTLQAVTAHLVAARTIEDVARAVVDSAVPALRAGIGGFFLRKFDGEAELVHGRERDLPGADSVALEVLLKGLPGVEEAIHARRIVAVSASGGEAPDGELAPPRTVAALDALASIGVRSAVWIPVDVDDDPAACILLGYPGDRTFDADDLALFTAVGQQCGQSLDRALASDAEHRARLAAERSAERTRRLQQATAALTIATEPLEVTRVLTDHVRRLVDADGVALFSLDEEAQELVLVDNGLVAGTEAGAQVVRVPLDAPLSLAQAARDLEDIWIHDATEWEARFPHGAQMLRSGFESIVVMPLVDKGRALGVLAMVFRTPLQLDDDDRSVLATLRDLAAHAVERASRFAAERTVARTLQQSLLPRTIEVTDRCRVAVRYEPAGDQLAVGGDWYDALILGPDRLALMVGDVVGRGLHAAASMGQLRSALGALTVRSESPGAVLEMLDRFAARIDGGEAATVAFAVLDTACGRMRYACAGHPPPLLLEPGEPPRFLDGGRSWPLGIGHPERARSDADVRIRPGSAVVLYTDGLVERRRVPLDDRLQALADAAASGPFDDPAVLCDRLFDSLLDDQPRDDVALLSLFYDPALADHAHWVFPSIPHRVRDARELTRRWLRRLGVEDPVASDIVLACDEACANAVEHGNHDAFGEIELDLSLDAHGEVSVTVSDHGSWRPPRGDRDRGHGLMLMEALMESVDIQTDARGTTVRLTRPMA